MRVYLLPGIACDHRLFDRIDLTGSEVVALDWPAFPTGCTLTSIAEELAKQVDREQPHVLVGVSMGGMVAQELAMFTNPKKVVLISSWMGPQEQPLSVRVSKALHFWWMINSFTMKATWPLKRFLGQREGTVDKLLYEMAVKEGAPKIRTGLKAIMRWKGSPWKGPVVRIHGDKDLVTPLRFPVDHVVKGGEHIMVMTCSKEISSLLRSVISA